MKRGVEIHSEENKYIRALSEGSTELPRKYQILGASVLILNAIKHVSKLICNF